MSNRITDNVLTSVVRDSSWEILARFGGNREHIDILDDCLRNFAKRLDAFYRLEEEKCMSNQVRKMECDMCDGTGLMEGWNRRDGNSCPKCKGLSVIDSVDAAAARIAVLTDVAQREDDRVARSAAPIAKIIREHLGELTPKPTLGELPPTTTDTEEPHV